MSPTTRYPRRWAAKFTDENSHNPLVLQDCPACGGRGKRCEHTRSAQGVARFLVECSACSGSGVTGEVEPYFAEDPPEASSEIDSLGWLTCPNCGWRFATHHADAWTGQRHMLCGQRILIR